MVSYRIWEDKNLNNNKAIALQGIGIKYGKYSIKLPHNKSLIGSIAFIVFATVSMFVPCFIMGYGFSLIPQLIILGTVGAIAELYTGDWDNIVIPVIVSILAFLII